MEEIGERSERQSPPVPWAAVPWKNDDDYDHDDVNRNDNDDRNADPYLDSIWKFGDCFLWNPVSLETIQLPSLIFWVNKSNHYYTIDCVLSSPPKSNNPDDDDDDDGDYVVSFLFSRDVTSHDLVFCRRGDKQWRKHEFNEIEDRNYPQSLFCFNGKLYVQCRNDLILKVEKFGTDDDGDGDDGTLVSSLNVKHETHSLSMTGYGYDGSRSYHVESFDELFKVKLDFFSRGGYEQVVKIEVSRLNFSLMAWEEVKNLGDHVLFVGKNTTAFCSTADLGLTRGCVYYTLRKDIGLYIFDLVDTSISVCLPCPKLPTPWLSPAWMIIPMTSRLGNGAEDVNVNAEEKESEICINNDDKEGEGKMENGGELEEGETFGILNVEILEVLAYYLHPVDYLHCRAVSKAIRSANPVLNWRTSSIKIQQTTPWLVFLTDNGSIYNFVNPMHGDEKHLMNVPEMLLGATIHFSKDGWLLMSKGHKTLFFYNPFTRAMIQLPDLPNQWCYMLTNISFSSIPTSSDCLVFAFNQFVKQRVFIFVIARGDDHWTSAITHNSDILTNRNDIDDPFESCLNNPVFYDGAFYYLDYNATLGVFKLENDFCWKILAEPQPPCNSAHQSFLVECDGELLSVFLGHMGKFVRIFRLDISTMVWVKVESLGKHMLFISDTTSLSAVAPTNLMENKIYFPRLHSEGILFYSLDTGMYHSLENQYSTQHLYNTKEQLNCTWIEPHWTPTTVQEIDWLSI